MFYEGTFDFSAIDEINKDIADIGDTFKDAMLDTAIDIEQTYIPQLSAYPATRAKHPFEFTTPKSRRKYFAMIRNGEVRTDDYGYVRNGGYGKSWRVEATENGNEYTIEVFSTFPASKYVGGANQVAGHRNTGWILYAPILAQIDEFANRQFFEVVTDNV
jgi:hypothetical protein